MNSQIAKIIDNKEYSPSDFKNSEYLVNFIGDNSQYYFFPFCKIININKKSSAQVPRDKIAKFIDNLPAYSTVKQKKLISSINIAKRILNGDTTYDKERDKLMIEKVYSKIHIV